MKFGFPSIKKTLKAREDRIRDDLESAAHAKEEAETELAQYRAQLANARAEATQIVEEGRQAAESVRHDLIAKAEADAAEIRNRARRTSASPRSARSPTCGPRSRTCRSSSPRRSSSTTSTATPRSRSSRTTSTRWGTAAMNRGAGGAAAVTTERTKAEAYAQALLEVARGEGRSPTSRTTCSASPGPSKASDELRLALTDPALPVERRIAVVEELTGGKALPASTALLSMLVAAGQASELSQIVDRFVELAAAERKREVAEVRSAIPLDATQTQRLAEALGRATGKGVEVKVIVDPERDGRPRRAASATPSSTAASGTASNR